MKSSRKPIAPQARVAKSTSIASVLRLDRMMKGSAVATRISRPPMVGVPCFSAWPSGMSPAGRTNWPTSLARSQAMNFGPRNIRSVAAQMAAMRTRGTPYRLRREGRGDPLQAHRARPLQQHHVALAQQAGHRSIASSTVAMWTASRPSAPATYPGARSPTATSRSMPAAAAASPTSRW